MAALHHQAHLHWNLNMWRNVMFSDESRLCLWQLDRRVKGPHLHTDLCVMSVYDHFHADFGIYQFGRERTLRSDLTSALSSCTQI